MNRIFPQFSDEPFPTDESSEPAPWIPESQAHTFESFDAEIGPWIVRDEPTLHQLDDEATVFVPEYYEATYPYPILVRLSAANSTPDEFHTWMSAISPRNFLGLDVPCDGIRETEEILDALQKQLAELRQTWHVHTERIILAGQAAKGQSALKTFLARPEWFGGVIAVNSRFQGRLSIPFRNPGLRDKRILLGCCRSKSAIRSTVKTGRTLSAAGLEVVTRLYDGDRIEDSTLTSDINAWMIEATCVAV